MKYFTETVEYPSKDCFSKEILPLGVLYEYVSSSFLNGLVNYAKPVIGMVVNRYKDWNEPFDEPKIIEFIDPSSHKWAGKECKTKQEIYDLVCSNVVFTHTKLDIFRDDVVLISRVEHSNVYYYFWFDHDVSDCCIGRFYTEDSQEVILEELNEFLKEFNPIKPLPLEFFKGWISF